VDVWSLVAEEPVVAGEAPALTGWLDRFCRAAARNLPASAAGVSVMTSEGDPAVVAASSEFARDVEQLQFTLGEGPCQDAYAQRQAVLVPQVTATLTRWPGYAPALLQHGVRAVFAFPLQVGGSRLGALDLYREQSGPLSDAAVVQGFAFAEVATTTLLDSQDRAGLDVDPDHGAVLGAPLVVYQAQGMVHVQLGIGLGQALGRLRAYAFSHDRSLSDVARDVVARRLVIEPDPAPGPGPG
jgi:hypothetical protein